MHFTFSLTLFFFPRVLCDLGGVFTKSFGLQVIAFYYVVHTNPQLLSLHFSLYFSPLIFSLTRPYTIYNLWVGGNNLTFLDNKNLFVSGNAPLISFDTLFRNVFFYYNDGRIQTKVLNTVPARVLISYWYGTYQYR